MKGKTWSESAAIEAWEEAGVRGQLGKASVGRYTYLPDAGDGEFNAFYLSDQLRSHQAAWIYYPLTRRMAKPGRS